MDKFVAKLKQVGYKGTLNVEREIDDLAQKKIDMKKGVDLLKRLRPPSYSRAAADRRPASSITARIEPFDRSIRGSGP